MTKHEQNLNNFIRRIRKTDFANINERSSILNDAIFFLSEITEVIGTYGEVHWQKKINEINFGNGITSRDIDLVLDSGKKQLISIFQDLRRQVKKSSESAISRKSNRNDPKIFLSHSSKDKKYGDALKTFISALGVKNDQLIYTSHPLHKIPNGINIFDYLRDCINKDVYVLFLLSNSYFKSPACMNEMGAAWITKSNYISVYIPNFDYNNPDYNGCAIDTKKMGIVLDNDSCSSRMIELKNEIQTIFGLSDDEQNSNYIIQSFCEAIKNLQESC